MKAKNMYREDMILNHGNNCLEKFHPDISILICLVVCCVACISIVNVF